MHLIVKVKRYEVASYQLHFQTVSYLTDGKSLNDARPIPGYKGFIPHVRTSDVGLGSRFHNMAKEGYDALYAQKLEDAEKKADDASRTTVEPKRYNACAFFTLH